MRHRALIIIAAAALAAAALMPEAASAMVGAGVQPSLDGAAATDQPIETIGCYRMGETGYHWYHFCAGPRFLYPHRRVCRHHHCWYR